MVSNGLGALQLADGPHLGRCLGEARVCTLRDLRIARCMRVQGDRSHPSSG